MVVKQHQTELPETRELIFRHCSDNTSALSWLLRAAHTRRPPIHQLARLLQAVLTTSPIPLQMSSNRIAGVLNDNADHLSPPVTKAPTWASVIELS